MQSLVGDQCWLTVIDDLGKSPPNNPTRKSGAQTAWYDIVNRRYLKRGWTIITSNSTLEQLAEQGTINDATYSRLAQMTRRTMIVFIGADYRLIDVYHVKQAEREPTMTDDTTIRPPLDRYRFDLIVARVCEHFKVSRAQLLSATRGA